MLTNDLKEWIELQACRSAEALERAISATGLTRRRAAFGQLIVPARGSVLASPVIADWDPEPDYFFHWVRDSAVVMRSVAGLMEDARTEGERQRWRRHFEDFVAFSLELTALNGAAFLESGRYREATGRGWRKFLRNEEDIRTLTGDKLLGEPRFNPDGTLDILRWSRPQYDGPALRALACLSYLAAGGPTSDGLARLLRQDLVFTVRHAGRRCIGPWEEPGQKSHHYPVALVQLAAVFFGKSWAEGPERVAWQRAEERLRVGLAAHWSPELGVYRAMGDTEDGNAKRGAAEDSVDASQLIAVVEARLPDGPLSVLDPKVEATERVIEDLFARELPINRTLGPGEAPALGRYKDDRYFGGGAWYVTTLAAAALFYLRALSPGQDRSALIARGDSFLATVKRLTPADGALSEQVDRETGAQSSARHLTWSYAAFLETARLRRRALTSLRDEARQSRDGGALPLPRGSS